MLNFLAWGFLDLITNLNVHRNCMKHRSQVTNSQEKTFFPHSRPRIPCYLLSWYKGFSSSFFHLRYSPSNIQVLCKGSHYMALMVSRLHLLSLVIWAINSKSLNETYTLLYAYHAGFYFISGSRSSPFVLCKFLHF